VASQIKDHSVTRLNIITVVTNIGKRIKFAAFYALRSIRNITLLNAYIMQYYNAVDGLRSDLEHIDVTVLGLSVNEIIMYILTMHTLTIDIEM